MKTVITYFRVYEEIDEPDDWGVTTEEYKGMITQDAYDRLDTIRELVAPSDVELVTLSIDDEEIL